MTPNLVSAREAARWIADGEAILIDVRGPDEFRAMHIPAAISLPLDTLPASLAGLRLPAHRRVVFQCQKGARGAAACALVGGAGPMPFNLDRGLEGWTAAGLPVVGPQQTLPLFRQAQIAVGLIVLALVLAGFALSAAFFVAAGAIGLMLALAGVTGWRGLARLLRRMPWNRPRPGVSRG